ADAAQQQPDESEKLSFVSGFLDHFVNIDPVTVKRNTTLALNEMTTTLRRQILAQLNEQHFVDTVRDNNVTATLAVKSAELVSGDPYTAVVFGQKRLTTLINGQENKKELLVKYVIRLAPVPRTRHCGYRGAGDWRARHERAVCVGARRSRRLPRGCRHRTASAAPPSPTCLLSALPPAGTRPPAGLPPSRCPCGSSCPASD